MTGCLRVFACRKRRVSATLRMIPFHDSRGAPRGTVRSGFTYNDRFIRAPSPALHRSPPRPTRRPRLKGFISASLLENTKRRL